MSFDPNVQNDLPDDTAAFNPFVQHEPAAIAAAVQRVNAVTDSWGNATAGVKEGAGRRTQRDVLRRTKRTRYVVLQQNPLKTADRRAFMGLPEALAMVGVPSRLISAVAGGLIPIVVAEGADPMFRTADVALLRNAYGASPFDGPG